MEANELKNTIQDFAIEKWKSKDKVGTIETPSLNSKTFIFLKALYTMPKDDKKTIHLFLSETMTREKEALAEIVKFDEIFNLDVLRDYNLQFFSYVGVSSWQNREFGLVCCDKFQEQLTVGNFKFHLNNKYKALIGVTNSINKYSFFSIKSDLLLSSYFDKKVVSKEEMLDKIAPVCFKYNIRGDYKKPVKNKLNIFVIKNKLDATNRNVRHETFKSITYKTEEDSYNLIMSEINELKLRIPEEGEDLFEFTENKIARMKILLNRRNKLLYTLGSKKILAEGLLFRLRGRTMIFGNNLQSLEILTVSKVLCMKNTDERNSLIKRTFDNGKLRAISNYCDMEENPDISMADNCLFKDVPQSKEDFVEKIASLRTLNKEKAGNVFIFVTEGTQEVAWLNESLKGLNEHKYMLCDNLISTFNKYSIIEDY
jgi:hypothetical protein